MSCAATATASFHELTVTAITTAGVHANATRAGDPTRWHETATGSQACDQFIATDSDQSNKTIKLIKKLTKLLKEATAAGTIIHLIHINVPCSAGCLTRAATIATEAKSTALLDWRIPSRQSAGLATGTGTDQLAIAAPLADSINDNGEHAVDPTWERQWAGSHHKLGELIADTVYRSTQEALAQQNGLSPTLRRSVVAAFERFGISEALILERAEQQLSAEKYILLQKNLKAALHDPRSAAAAYACADACDLQALLPDMVLQETYIDQAALLATTTCWRPDQYQSFRQQLSERHQAHTPAGDIIVDALLLGYEQRWS